MRKQDGRFFGRQTELNEFNRLSLKKTSSLAVLWGRRRIGKSALAEKFGQKFDHFYVFQGLAPRPKQSNKDQLNYFSEKIHEYFKGPEVHFKSWTEAFTYLNQLITNESTCILFDEISWMGGKDKEFTSKLKAAWDTQFKHNNKLIMILCGSVSSWIEKNILKNTDFVGRISSAYKIDELNLYQSNLFWRKNISTNEKLILLMLTGGVPKYLEEVCSSTNALKTLSEKCFSANGFFLNEFDKIFSDIFGRKSESYQKIILSLAMHKMTAAEISKKTKVALNGKLTDALDNLCISGFLSKENIFNLDGTASGKTIYRLKDNYLRFYLKFIRSKKDLILKNRLHIKDIEALPEWNTFKGYQFENLIYNSVDQLYKMIDVNSSKIYSAGPYLQKKNSKIKVGCQIDLLINENNKIYTVCEFKSGLLNNSIPDEVESKINAIKFPKKSMVKTVLITTEDTSLISESIKHYFDQVICLDDFFDTASASG